MLSHVQVFVAPWTVAHQALLSMDFSRQEYWNGLPFPPPRDLPNPGIEPVSPVSCLAGGLLPLSHLGSPEYEVGGYIIIFFSVYLFKHTHSIS